MMKQEALMNSALKNLLIWTPRVLGVIFILFVARFSLDVFVEDNVWWLMLIAFLMHNLPVMVMMTALTLAWVRQWEWAGAIGYIGFAIWYTGFASGNPFEWGMVVLGGIPALIGALFLMVWVLRTQRVL